MPNLLVPRRLGDMGVGQSGERGLCGAGSRKQKEGASQERASHVDLALPLLLKERIGMRGKGPSQGPGGIQCLTMERDSTKGPGGGVERQGWGFISSEL